MNKKELLKAISSINNTAPKHPIGVLLNKAWAEKYIINKSYNSIPGNYRTLLGIRVYWDNNIESYKFIYEKEELPKELEDE